MLRLEISGVDAPVNEKLQRYIRHRIGGLQRFIPRRARKGAYAEIRLRETGVADKNQCTCEATLHLVDEIITMTETTVNMYAAIDIVQEKLKYRLRQYKVLHPSSKLRHHLLRQGNQSSRLEVTTDSED